MHGNTFETPMRDRRDGINIGKFIYEIPRLPAVVDRSWERGYWAWIEGIRISRRIREFFEVCDRMGKLGFQMKVLLWLAMRDAELCRDEKFAWRVLGGHV